MHCRHVPTHFFLKMPQSADAAIDICVMYRPDQSARTHSVLGEYMYKVVIPETENPQEAKSVYPGRPVWHA